MWRENCNRFLMNVNAAQDWATAGVWKRRRRRGVRAGRAVHPTFRADVAAAVAAVVAADHRPTAGWTARTMSAATAGHLVAARSAGTAQVGAALCMTFGLLNTAYSRHVLDAGLYCLWRRTHRACPLSSRVLTIAAGMLRRA